MWVAIRRGLYLIGRPVVWLMIGLIKVYQWGISPLLGPRCKFYPSCSAYAEQAIRHHGPVKGSLLAGYRLCRCHPWQLGGINPIPPAGAWRPDINLDGSPRETPNSRRQLSGLGV